MTVSIAAKPGDKVLFVGETAAWLEKIVKVTEYYVFSVGVDEKYADQSAIRMKKSRIRPMPEGVTGAVGCYRRSH